MTRNSDKANNPVSVNLYLDSRRKKDNGLFPIKIRVYDAVTKKARLYTTDFDLSQNDFDRMFFPEVGQRLRKEETEIRQDLESLKGFYSRKVKDLSSFTFEELEKSLEVKAGDELNVFYCYDTYIKDLRDSGRISTASSYELGMKSLKAYLKAKTGKEAKTLLFQDVSVKFLNGYEKWMIEVKGKSFTTVGFYLRSLRVIFNLGIESNVVNKDLYPFGVKRY